MSAGEPPNPDDPIDAFLERKEIKGAAEESLKTYSTALNHHLRNFLSSQEMRAEEMTEADAENFLHDLQNEVSGGTAQQMANFVENFYGHYADRGTFDKNPVSLALEDHKFDKEHREHREVPIGSIREVCQNEKYPLVVLLFTILPKTGMRIRELQSMNLEDIHLDHPRVNEHLPSPRYEIENEPDTLYIPPVLSNNKRKYGAHVPIDDELKRALVYWVGAYYPTPPEEEKDPLVQIRSSAGHGRKQGSRASVDRIRRLIKETAKRYGLYDHDNEYHENLTPHKFRHFFSTYAQNENCGGEMDREVVKYIRGDTGGETISDYEHLWGKDTRIEYLNNIFKLYE